jgi:hypothetical protein
MTGAHRQLIEVFETDGHLAEAALVALADGQDVLPEAAAAHLGACDACCGRLAEMAHASVQVSELLRAAVPARESVASNAPAPWSAIAGMLALAVLGMTPSVARAPELFGQTAPALRHMGPVLAHGLSAAFGAQGALAWQATLSSSALLIVFGFTVARWFRHEGAAS